MVNISSIFYQDLHCARKGQLEAASTDTITKADVGSIMPDATTHIDTVAAAFEYEVICPNCARVERANTSDLFKHKCNCGYGVYVEMVRMSAP